VEYSIIKLSNLLCNQNNQIICKQSVKTTYFAYLHSSLKYGILFWGNSLNIKKCLNYTKKKLQTILQIITDYDTTLCVCVYIYTRNSIHTKIYLSRFKTNFMFHSYDTRNNSDLLQVKTPNYLHIVLLTKACLFITNYPMK